MSDPSKPIIHKVFFAAEEASIEPWQRALTKGDKFVYRSTSTDQLMWAEVLEEPNPKLGAYRFVRVFSEGKPEGEEGDVHVACALGKLGATAWRVAREDGWPNDRNAKRYERFALKLDRERIRVATAN